MLYRHQGGEHLQRDGHDPAGAARSVPPVVRLLNYSSSPLAIQLIVTSTKAADYAAKAANMPADKLVGNSKCRNERLDRYGPGHATGNRC